jgi:hypothetical protein
MKKFPSPHATWIVVGRTCAPVRHPWKVGVKEEDAPAVAGAHIARTIARMRRRRTPLEYRCLGAQAQAANAAPPFGNAYLRVVEGSRIRRRHARLRERPEITPDASRGKDIGCARHVRGEDGFHALLRLRATHPGVGCRSAREASRERAPDPRCSRRVPERCFPVSVLRDLAAARLSGVTSPGWASVNTPDCKGTPSR